MKSLIILVIGITVGYYFGMENVDSISGVIDITRDAFQFAANKLGEYND